MLLQTAEFSVLRPNNIPLYVYTTYILIKSFWYILDTSAHQIYVLCFLPFCGLSFLLKFLSVCVCVRERERDWKFFGVWCGQCIHMAQNAEDTKFYLVKSLPFAQPHHFPFSGSRFPSPEATSVTSFWRNFLEVDVKHKYESACM